MQINNTLQPSEFHSTIDKVIEKAPPAEVKIRSDFEGKSSPDGPDKLAELKSVLAEGNIQLSFSQDETTKTLIVKMVDKTTGDEIRQIPTEVSLKLVAINAKLLGNFVDKAS